MSASEEPRSNPTPPARRSWADLGPRFASALVLVAVTVMALVVGGYLFAAVVGIVFGGAYREWETMVTLKPLSIPGVILMGLVVVSALVFPLFGIAASLGVIAAAAIIGTFLGGEEAPWRVAGLSFFGLVIVAVLAMRGTGPDGIFAGLFLGSVIWLTDTGAFFTGRQLGGEKLAPGISPGKTWSGAFGGLLLGTLSGTVLWIILTESPWWIGVLLALVLSVLGQLGDLAESAVKRRFRVKDSGDIIPGHGGLMDRLDSLTFGVMFVFLVGFVHQGYGAVAAGFLHW